MNTKSGFRLILKENYYIRKWENGVQLKRSQVKIQNSGFRIHNSEFRNSQNHLLKRHVTARNTQKIGGEMAIVMGKEDEECAWWTIKVFFFFSRYSNIVPKGPDPVKHPHFRRFWVDGFLGLLFLTFETLQHPVQSIGKSMVKLVRCSGIPVSTLSSFEC